MVIVALGSVSGTAVHADDIPKHEEKPALIKSAYDARYQLVQRSKGNAQFRLKVEIDNEADKALKSRINNDLGIVSSKLRTSGEANWTISWTQVDKRVRFDKEVLPGTGESRELAPPGLTRLSVDPEQSIHYNVQSKEGYVNKPKKPAVNPTTFINFFEIGAFYKFESKEVYELLEKVIGTKELNYSVLKDKVDGIECEKHAYDWKVPSPGNRVASTRFGMWLAPTQSYSLLKAEFISSYSDSDTGDRNAVGYGREFTGKYKESKDHPGIWLLTDYKCRYEARGKVETLNANFTYEGIGIDVPDRIFGWENLQVPDGTLVFDRRLGGAPKTFRYVGGTLKPDMSNFSKETAITSATNSVTTPSASELTGNPTHLGDVTTAILPLRNASP